VTAVLATARVRAIAVPTWAWLTAIVVCSAALRAALAHEVVAPWIMVDELIYSELAKSFAAHGTFDVRGVPSHGYGFVYPVLIAPAWRLFGPMPSVYAAAKDIGAVAMSLAALPAYFLARRLLSRWLALLAAVLAVAIPSLLYTGELMTENVFYPIFLAATLLLVATLERPTWRRQVALLVVCGLAYATRAQAIVFLPAILLSPPLLGWIERDLRARLRRFAPLYGIVAALVVLALLGTAARGRSPLSLLGAYRAATGEGYSATTVLHYLLWHVAELDLYVGVVPFAALLGLWLAPRRVDPAARVFAAATFPLSVLLVVEVATFASTESQRIEERNMFYVAPFMLIALLGLVRDRVVPRGRTLWLAAAAVAVLPLAVPFTRFVNTSAVSDTFALLPWWWVQDRGVHFSTLHWVAFAAAVVAASAVFLPRRAALVVPVLVLVYFGLTTAVVLNGRHGIRQASVGALRAGVRMAHPDWIDRAAGRSANVSLLWPPQPEVHPVWENEFFNRSVGAMYTIGPDPWNAGFPETTVRIGKGGVVTGPAGPVRVAYALVPTDVAGTRVAADSEAGLSLYRVDGPLIAVVHVGGLYPRDTWAGRHVVYTRTHCTGGRLTVTLETDGQLFDAAQPVTAREHGGVVGRVAVPNDRTTTLTVPLEPRGGVCEVDFTAATVRVPAQVQPGSTDTRRLAAHYLSFVWSP
jgi:hypothetical protein